MNIQDFKNWQNQNPVIDETIEDLCYYIEDKWESPYGRDDDEAREKDDEIRKLIVSAIKSFQVPIGQLAKVEQILLNDWTYNVTKGVIK